MKKTLICSIPMRDKIDKVVYSSEDPSLPASLDTFYYPINSFLSETLSPDDSITAILIEKQGKYSCCKKNSEIFCNELNEICAELGVAVSYEIVNTEFVQKKRVHELLMKDIVDHIQDGSTIIADVTFGPKDVPIVVFAAMEFAESQLHCEVANILYGQADFIDGSAMNTKLCDMIPLYCLNSAASTIKCNNPSKARQMLGTLLSL